MDLQNRCALCGNQAELKLSHIIPKFVFRYLKKDSFTGRMRMTSDPNRAVQDGDKIYLLCGTCEGLFSKNETYFSNTIYRPFKEGGFNGLKYDKDSLYFFITSVNWRTLYLDLIEFCEDKDEENKATVKQLELLKKAEEIMRSYLLGERSDLDNIENHIFFFDTVKSMEGPETLRNPHVLVQGSAFGYTVLANEHDAIYVFANLTGAIIVTIIKKAKKEKWKNTFVKRESGKIKVPQFTNSPVFSELFYWQEQRDKYLEQMSEKQRNIINEKIINDQDGFEKSGTYKRFIKDTYIETK
ncbi:hypothetical protein [Metabacillus idriensis]|uniref:hypothetical protein n=1 Tax=Metabacillus idriensis TaxID=324768 RepID=UPI00174E6ABB|nr:hypothetical protein [Metabacillus idriensis]